MSLPLNGNNGCINGKLTLLFLFAVVTQSIAIGHFTHAGRNSGQIRKSFRQAGLTASAVSQQHHITNLVSCVNFHLTFLQFLCNLGVLT